MKMLVPFLGIFGVLLILVSIIWLGVLLVPGPERWPIVAFVAGLLLTLVAVKWDDL